MNRHVAAVGAVLAVGAVTAGCRVDVDQLANLTATDGGAPSSRAVLTVTTSTVKTARIHLAALPVKPEDTGAHYDREAWPHWSDLDHDGCDTRDEALAAQAVHPYRVRRGHCTPPSGAAWRDPYGSTSTPITTAHELDLDHSVSLKEAEQSGARHWTRDQREAYANDPRVVIVTTAHENRSKGDDDVATWRPPAHADWCGFAARVVDVKHRYHLSVDQPERSALRSMLNACTTTKRGDHR